VQGRVVREIRMLRAMWRELQTGLRNDLFGHKGGETLDTDKADLSELPRQLSTLSGHKAGWPLRLSSTRIYQATKRHRKCLF
jgi:hypothetical protein